MLITHNETETLTKKDLTEIFYSGCKEEKNIGVESEKILVYKNDNKAIKYETAVEILKCFDSCKWQKIYEKNNLMGLKGDTGTITLEPGSQIEISLRPYNTIDEIKTQLDEFYTNLKIYSEKFGTKVLDIGIQPVSTFDDIKIIPKQRYEYMTKYLPLKGLTPYIMMRETAGIQANFDYKTEEEAIEKLSLALKMSPIISALYSNSCIRKGKQTGYKSFRANSWLNVDEERCGYISKKLFDNHKHFSFADYTDILMDVPMIFVERNGEYYGTTQTFREFMTNGYMGLQAKISDWETHISLYFPDVRLKSYVEIRNHDAQNREMTYSVPAFWKGIMYNQPAIDEINCILSKYKYEEYIELRKSAPLIGISAKLGNREIIELLKEFFDISYNSLKELKSGEEKYLDPAYEYINSKKVPADYYNFE